MIIAKNTRVSRVQDDIVRRFNVRKVSHAVIIVPFGFRNAPIVLNAMAVWPVDGKGPSRPRNERRGVVTRRYPLIVGTEMSYVSSGEPIVGRTPPP